MKRLDDFEKKIFYNRIGIKNKTKSFVRDIIEAIVSGILNIGYKMPSIEQLAEISGLSYSTITRVFTALAAQGYLIRINGTNAIVTDPFRPHLSPDKESTMLHYENYCIGETVLTADLTSLYDRVSKRNRKSTVPSQRNMIYEDLIETCCGYINTGRNGKYQPANIFYLHDYQAMVKAVGMVIKPEDGAVIIPDTASMIIRDALGLSPLNLIELPYGNNKYQIADLTSRCKLQKIAAIYLTPYLSYFTAQEADAVIRLQKEYNFKLIIDDRHRPWFYKNTHLMLDTWAEIIDSVISIEPLSYLSEDLSRFNLVAANPQIIKEVRLAAKKNGQQAYFYNAFAANTVLRSKLFKTVSEQVNKEIKELKKLINEIFYEADFWKPQPERLSSTPAMFFSAKHYYFPPCIVQQLKIFSIEIVDPEMYNPGYEHLDGIRIEFGSLVGRKNLKLVITSLYKLLKTVVEDYGIQKDGKAKSGK